MLRRGKRPTVGMMVEVSQMANTVPKWLPFVITDVHDDDMVSGVAFSGIPGPLGWNNRGAQPFHGVVKGSDNRMWRFKRGRQASDEDEMEDMAPEPEPMENLQEGDMPEDPAEDGEPVRRRIMVQHPRQTLEINIPSIHVAELPKPPVYVVDVVLWSEGDIVSMQVDYSDGTSKIMVAPAVSATGSFQ